MTREYTKTYGIIAKNGRYKTVIDVKIEPDYHGNRRIYYHENDSKGVLNLDLAMGKADLWVRTLWKNFTDFRGDQVNFKFINLGLIPHQAGTIVNGYQEL